MKQMTRKETNDQEGNKWPGRKQMTRKETNDQDFSPKKFRDCNNFEAGAG